MSSIWIIKVKRQIMTWHKYYRLWCVSLGTRWNLSYFKLYHIGNLQIVQSPFDISGHWYKIRTSFISYVWSTTTMDVLLGKLITWVNLRFYRSLFVLFLLAIGLSVLLRFTASDYHIGIFKLFLLRSPKLDNFLTTHLKYKYILLICWGLSAKRADHH